ncbi:MAG: 2-amino-4-hydroxy-6-hydroxymethyldihydropteridine diphosphokinase [Thalassotalea sp.]|nr:2-amino-4-hydroxy-6-hydroxymethyldihydropteridine diphosphokinase [Thalassotalea sp.]
MVQVYLSIGSNIDRESNLRSGLTALAELFDDLTLSSLFESEAVGFDGSPFYNMVVGFQTTQNIEQLSKTLREIEFKFGRELNAKKFSPRTLDLDILLYGDLIQTEPVQLPRDEITFNAFVLWPLAEIAPQQVHPVLKKTYQSLWQSYDKETQHLQIIPFNWQG